MCGFQYIMAKEGGAQKYDANTEAFQMRAQWKKTDMCRKQWHERWSWLLEERAKAIEEADQIRQANTKLFLKPITKIETTKCLKPVPLTSTGFVGWLASKPECKLEIYTSWLNKPVLKLPDAWDYKDYVSASGSH
ncbi:uncharacterized protein LOC126380537 [Pectinophora gossypiella]|uniref:uncharacterized protein LOC126380537 n=1 Tax=Pectinophora gossypiella TaxID=13191 RepID=UPI00214F4E45|nr:uncharacterized protein LOC126380537 [Pectinophora gossypiella]